MSQLKKNLTFNILSLIVNVAVGFFYTPYLVDNLGVVAYGVLPLAMIVNQYISILTTSLTGSLTRFYSVEINKKDYEKASSYLSGALIVLVGIILISLPLLFLIVWKVETIFNIPEKLILSTKILFLFTFFGFFSSLITSFFSIVLYAKNQLDLLNKINILRVSSKVILNIALFELLFVDIKFVGIGNFIGESIVLLYAYVLFRRNIHPEVIVRLRKYEKFVFSSLLTMTLWVIIHQIGDLAIYKTDILFVNKFWSTVESGILGAISDFGTYIMMIIGVVSSLFGPLILIAYSKENHDEVKRLALTNTLLVGLITSLIVSVLIGFSYEFLFLWLGEQFASKHLWLDIKLVTLPFYAAAGIFAFVYRSWNRVKLPAIITLSLGVIAIIVTYLISSSSHTDSSIQYILISNAIITLLQTFVLGGFMIMSIYPDIKISSLLKIGLKMIGFMFSIIILSRVITNYITISNWFVLILCIATVGLFGALFMYFVLLKSNQRKHLTKLLIKDKY